MAEMGHFLQITIARKTRPFLKKNHIQFLVITNCRNGPLSANYDRKKNLPFLKRNYTISPDSKLQNRATFCKLRSEEKLDHFSRKTVQFLLIANCRIGPLSANYNHKRNYTISPDRELQKWATFCKLRSQGKLYHFSRKPIQFLLIANCRIGPLSGNYDHKKN